MQNDSTRIPDVQNDKDFYTQTKKRARDIPIDKKEILDYAYLECIINIVPKRKNCAKKHMYTS